MAADPLRAGTSSPVRQTDELFRPEALSGSLGQAEGDVPLPSGERVAVRWQAEGDRIRYTVSAPSEAIEIVTDRGERIRVKPFATRTVCLKASQK